MASSLSLLSVPVQRCLLRKGPRLFALLGKATPSGLVAFRREDIAGSWAVTAEFGCLRLERLSGDEEMTGDQLYLPTPSSYQYGISGLNGSAALTRAVFGLLPEEVDQLVNVLRRGSFPMLGYAAADLKCGISSCVIPASWPHVVTSNLALYGSVLSVESFIRILVSSLPQGQLGVRFPTLQPVFKWLMRLRTFQRRGILYTQEMLTVAPGPALMAR